MTRKFHIVGNWKMNQTLKEIETFFSSIDQASVKKLNCEAWVAPQALHLSKVLELSQVSGSFQVGAQNINQKDFGAFTGENSPASLKEIGATFTLVGHSERRAIYGENDDLLNQKTLKALEYDLTVIFCVGETLEERESNSTKKVIANQLVEGLKSLLKPQLNNVIVAYEPVWAIGTGKTATPEQAQAVHQDIRQELSQLGFDPEKIIILYGGSVKPGNIEGLLSQNDIDGALVGGASLKPQSFLQLCQAAHKLTI